jgi:hypothetical protein
MTMTGNPNFWKGVEAFHAAANLFVDAGIYVSYVLRPGSGLIVQPFVAPNTTVDAFTKVVQPFLDKLTNLNVTYQMGKAQTFPTFQDLHTSLFNFFDDGPKNTIPGGRLFSRDDVAKNDGAIVAAIQSIVEAGHVFGGHMVNPGRAIPDPSGNMSAVHPVWRNAADSSLWSYSLPGCLDEAGRMDALHNVTHSFGEALRKASPLSAVYSNEVSLSRL